MPVINVNLSMPACQIYAELASSRRASRIVSRLLIEWKNLTTEERGDLSKWTPQMLEYGDIRKMSDGSYCTFTESGFIPCDFGADKLDLKKVEIESESANEKWMREQKEMNE